MENANKALIVVATVLLSILIISLGFLIYKRSNSNIDIIDSKRSSMEMQTKNSKFETYIGKQSGAVVKVILIDVISYNKEMKFEFERTIGVYSNHNSIIKNIKDNYLRRVLLGKEHNRDDGITYEDNIKKIMGTIESRETYEISLDYRKNGIIKSIHID